MINKIEKYLDKKYEFKYNVLKSKTSYRKKETTDIFTDVTDYDLNSIKRELDKKGLKISHAELSRLLKSNFVPRYNPFEDYLKALPKYDYATDYIDKLANTVSTTNDDFFKWAFKKWLVGLIACALDKDKTNQQVLIITGKQGCGKTTWLKNLVPESFKDYVYNGSINPNNKDTKIAMSEYLILNMDEMSTYTKVQIESFKEMITLDKITERKPYGLCSETYPRISSFVGSSNENDVLIDLTGNRRFLCSEAIEINYQHNIDMDLVYSQAYQLYLDGYKYYFDFEDTKRIEENNMNFTKSSIENDWIDKLFQKPNENDSKIEYMNATEIGEFIKKKGAQLVLEPNQIGKIMKHKGFGIKKICGISKYIVSKK